MYEPGLDEEARQEKAEGSDDVEEGRRGARVAPEAPGSAAAQGHRRRGIRRAVADTPTQLAPVVGQVSHLEDGGCQEHGEQQHGSPGQHDVGVEL